MKKLIFLILPFIVACATPVADPNCGFETDSQGHRISWKGQVPIILTLDESFPVEYVSTLQDAIATWENVTGRQLFILQTGFTSYRNNYLKDGKNVIFLGTFDSPSTLGITKVWTRGDQIREADIGFAQAGLTYNVMVHELGHLLGLDHSSDMNSTMYPYNYSDQELTEVDVLNVKCEY